MTTLYEKILRWMVDNSGKVTADELSKKIKEWGRRDSVKNYLYLLVRRGLLLRDPPLIKRRPIIRFGVDDTEKLRRELERYEREGRVWVPRWRG